MLSLAQLLSGQSDKVISIEGGMGFRQRLENLGIRKGVMIKKAKGMSAYGPIVVKVGSAQIALGRGMASKVIIEVL